ncbi:YtxH domain-containing protein [Cytobacillus purgationiresistens]|uniref:Gas vesicle protein n=1 Tax=Cytobacillus purgationiresistens TaxID=863449 RepID=A0ABU0AJW3_9BACI|nr:YtxH domain-containing protein [Cytobacillus purgationiresistens]MDQ0271557.1 gas vesicle protein [Cytobacillus purgationiresistens]
MGKSLFWKGVLAGAIAGGALSMLDRSTRETAKVKCKQTTGNITYYIKHPDEVVHQVKDVSARIKIAAEQVSEDVAFITHTVEDLREAAENTKDAFSQGSSRIGNIEKEEVNKPQI